MERVETMDVLPGEGDERTTTLRRVREECVECGAPAHYRVAFLLEGVRTNPASAAYGKDDCTWCEDDHSFACREHKLAVQRHPPDGYREGSTFYATERFAHMFLRWEEVKE